MIDVETTINSNYLIFKGLLRPVTAGNLTADGEALLLEPGEETCDAHLEGVRGGSWERSNLTLRLMGGLVVVEWREEGVVPERR